MAVYEHIGDVDQVACEWSGHEYAPAGGGLLICIVCESEAWEEPKCNACGAALVPAGDAVVPLVRCADHGCGREVPRWPGDTQIPTERQSA